MKRLLLHICCGVCAFYPIEYLKKKGFSVSGFFFNPNIYPPQEYTRRKENLLKVTSLTQIELVSEEYLFGEWLAMASPYSLEPQGGKRCLLCYRLRLETTYQKALNLNFDYFSTTLTISPHKDSKKIIEIGLGIDKERFLAIDFKKDGGFTETMKLAKKHNLYRQRYCGCKFSLPQHAD